MSVERSVLIVDDEPAVRLALQVNLSRNGLKVQVASDAKEAAERLRAEPFDLVLTDVRMPGASGLELVQKIHEAWQEITVIVMTGQGSVADAVEAIRRGIRLYPEACAYRCAVADDRTCNGTPRFARRGAFASKRIAILRV